MSNGVRNVIRQRIAHTLSNACPSKIAEISANLYVKCDASTGNFTFSLPLKKREYDIVDEAENIVKNCRGVFTATGVKSDGIPLIDFKLPRDVLIKEVLDANVHGPSAPCILPDRQNIVVEYSSPNMAKPFHVGHLRSTIIGNYIANLYSFLNADVKRINYLGDWGTQYGYVQLGLNMLKISDEAMEMDPIRLSYKAYVHANKMAQDDPDVAKRARDIFENLEKGEKAGWEKWKNLQKYTIEELTRTYGRLGVRFDEYHQESMYGSSKIGAVINKMEKCNLLHIDSEKRKVVALNDERNVPIIKSDGSTLYLTRDIAAAIDRYKKYKFDFMYYVVENAQNDHFTNLIAILERMKQPCSDRLRHVKFGKIRGMSTRKGTAVLLQDFLDEARDTMREKQKNSLTTKVPLDLDDDSSDCLGISAVIIHDLKQKRQRDYDFNWDVALNIKGDTGVKLQYSHCRLVNIEKNSGTALPNDCDPTLLQEPIVNDLVTKIIQFDEAIFLSYRTLEPCHLVKYLFELSHVSNKAIKQLRVKDEPQDVGSQRLLLYRVTRNILAKGMRLLGLRPLHKM